MNARTDQRLPPATKKTDMHPFRGPIPLVRPPSPSSWCSPVRSRRTGGIGSGHRSGFGRPQAIKKAAGNAAQSGYECVEPGGPFPASPVQRKRREHFLQTVQKMGVFSKHPRVQRITPIHRKGSNQRMTRHERCLLRWHCRDCSPCHDFCC